MESARNIEKPKTHKYFKNADGSYKGRFSERTASAKMFNGIEMDKDDEVWVLPYGNKTVVSKEEVPGAKYWNVRERKEMPEFTQAEREAAFKEAMTTNPAQAVIDCPLDGSNLRLQTEKLQFDSAE